MTQHIFINKSGKLLSHWSASFPGATCVNHLSRYSGKPDHCVLWFEWVDQESAQQLSQLQQAIKTGAPVVVLCPTPNDEQAKRALSAGAKGYCHSLASTKQLSEIAVVVSNGGLWLGPGILQSLLNNTRQIGLTLPQSPESEPLQALSKRERDVATRVAKGFTNLEIADDLNISERTVKAHLTFIFKKLQTRDRIHLALYINQHIRT